MSHLHGLMCDMDKIKSIAKKNKTKFANRGIAAQAHGGSFRNKLPGYYSDAMQLLVALSN